MLFPANSLCGASVCFWVIGTRADLEHLEGECIPHQDGVPFEFHKERWSSLHEGMRDRAIGQNSVRVMAITFDPERDLMDIVDAIAFRTRDVDSVHCFLGVQSTPVKPRGGLQLLGLLGEGDPAKRFEARLEYGLPPRNGYRPQFRKVLIVSGVEECSDDMLNACGAEMGHDLSAFTVDTLFRFLGEWPSSMLCF